jgi:hypothetical protein
MQISRRGILGGLAGLIAAPAIVKISNIMPVRTPLWTPSLPHGPTYYVKSVSGLGITIGSPDNLCIIRFGECHGLRVGDPIRFIVK